MSRSPDRRAGLLVAFTVLLAPLWIPPAASAQEREPVPHFMERGYIFNRMPVESLLFEAQLAEHIYFYNSQPDAVRRVMTGDRDWRRGFSVSATPMVRLRMLQADSRPVRTPSYMPRFDLWWFFLRRRSESELPFEYYDDPVDVLALNVVPFGHHSNGQEGCTFTSSEQADGTCGPFPTELRDDDVNRISGDFSTNYVRLGLFYKRITMKADAFTSGWRSIGVELDVHPTGWGPGNISPELRRVYGARRLRARAEYMKVLDSGSRAPWLGRLRAAATAERSFGAAPGVRATSVTVEASAHPAWLGKWGFFARYFSGQDYYNVAFLDSRRWVQLGLVRGNPWREEFSVEPGLVN